MLIFIRSVFGFIITSTAFGARFRLGPKTNGNCARIFALHKTHPTQRRERKNLAPKMNRTPEKMQFVGTDRIVEEASSSHLRWMSFLGPCAHFKYMLMLVRGAFSWNEHFRILPYFFPIWNHHIHGAGKQGRLKRMPMGCCELEWARERQRTRAISSTKSSIKMYRGKG